MRACASNSEQFSVRATDDDFGAFNDYLFGSGGAQGASSITVREGSSVEELEGSRTHPSCGSSLKVATLCSVILKALFAGDVDKTLEKSA